MIGKSSEDPILIIISGLPATGKTTLARRIATHFALPAIHKDEIKETLCDVLGCADLAESKHIGKASILLLYQFAETILRSGQSCLIESFFHPELTTPELLALQQRCPFIPLQIHCHTESALALRRYKERFESGTRHPGHMDRQYIQNTNETSPLHPAFLQALPVGGHLIELDTTDFDTLDYKALFSHIEMLLRRF